MLAKEVQEIKFYNEFLRDTRKKVQETITYTYQSNNLVSSFCYKDLASDHFQIGWQFYIYRY